MKREIAIRAGRLLCMAVLGGVFALRAHGAVFNWNGAGANDNWTTAGNWAEGTPTNDGSADIQFGGSTRPTPNLDVDYSIHSLTFVASAANFTLASATNQTLTIGAGGITNSSINTQLSNLKLKLSAPASINASAGNIFFGSPAGTGSIDAGTNLLTVTGSHDTTINVAISGSGGLTKSGAGTLSLGFANTFTGPVTVNAGTLIATVDAALPDNVAYTVNGGTLDLNDFDVTMASLSGSGGTLDLGSAMLTVNQTTNTTYAGVITGTGALIKNGSGTLILTGTNTYTGATTIGAGSTLQIGNGGTTGSIDSTTAIHDNGILTYDRSDNITVSTLIDGTGQLRQIGTGTTTLTANNTYSGGTTIGPGSTLQVGNGGTTGSLGTGAVADNGTLVFNRSDDITINNAISGSGNLTKNGAGTLTLGAANSYGGNTNINNGTIKLGVAGALPANAKVTLGSGANSGKLDLNGQNATVSSLATSGTGANNIITNGGGAASTLTYAGGTSTFAGKIQDGTSTVALTETSGSLTLSSANTYTGATMINGGTLALTGTGSITSDTTVASGGTLTGTGAIGGTHDLINNGTLTPSAVGTASGALTVTGDYTNNANSTVNVSVSSAGTNSKLVVNGTATLNGGAVNVDISHGFTNGFHYNFLEADTAFAGTDYSSVMVNGGVNNFVKATLGRSGDMEFVVLQSLFGTIGRTTNERNVGHYLDQIAPGSGDLQTVLAAIAMLPNDEAAAAMEQLSGDIHGTLGQIDIQTTNLVIYQVAQRLRSATFCPGGSLSVCEGRAQRPDGAKIALVGCGPDGEPEFADACDDCGPRWSGWVQGFGLGGAAKSDGNAPGINYSSGGTIAGIERWVDDCHLLGFYGAYVGTDVQAQFDRTSTINGGDFGAYLMLDDGFSYYTLLGGFEFDGFSTNRLLQFDDINRTATSDYFGWENYYYLERGFSFESCNSVLQPFAALQYIYLRQNSFVESGANSIDLAGGGVTTNSLRSVLGARAQYAIYNGRGRRVLPEIHALWLHEFLDSNTIVRATFSPVPTGSSGFTAQGLDLGRDWALVGANLTWEMLGGWSMFVNGDIQTNAQTTFYVGSGGIGCQW